MQQQPDRNRMQAVDEARGQWLQSEERAKILAEKLSTALADMTSKDNLVKQHVKVAEEAVSGNYITCVIYFDSGRYSSSNLLYLHQSGLL